MLGPLPGDRGLVSPSVIKPSVYISGEGISMCISLYKGLGDLSISTFRFIGLALLAGEAGSRCFLLEDETSATKALSASDLNSSYNPSVSLGDTYEESI